MSEIKVNSVVNSTGDNDSGLDLSTNDQVIIKTANTTALTINSSQVATFAQPPVGTFISELDQFRLTADTSNGASGDITANLERVDDTTFSKIGTGMTENSGIYTFPSTGLYQVICNPTTIAVSDNALKVKTMISTDSGGSFGEIASTSGGGGGSSFDQNSPSTSVYINVTNASTFRIKFQLGSVGVSSRLVGSTTSTHTNFVFIKLGESQ